MTRARQSGTSFTVCQALDTGPLLVSLLCLAPALCSRSSSYLGLSAQETAAQRGPVIFPSHTATYKGPTRG